MTEIGEILRLIVTDTVIKDHIVWNSDSETCVKASEMQLFNQGFIDAYGIDQISLKKAMVKSMADARQRVRASLNRGKNKKK